MANFLAFGPYVNQTMKLKLFFNHRLFILFQNIIYPNHCKFSVRISVLRNFAKFIGKHLCQSLFFNDVAGLRPATLLKKKLWPEACSFIKQEALAQVFPCEFCEISKSTFFTEHLLVTASEQKNIVLNQF